MYAVIDCSTFTTKRQKGLHSHSISIVWSLGRWQPLQQKDINATETAKLNLWDGDAMICFSDVEADVKEAEAAIEDE